jgi:Carboxypeptidase regulatory-like domain
MCRNTSNLAVLAFSFVVIATGAELPGQEPGRQAGKPDLQQAAAQPVNASSKPGPGRMFVVGHVLDAKGQPVPGAAVAAFARIVRLGLRYSDAMTPIPIGNAIADESGHYRIDAPRTSASRHEFFGVVAVAPGHGAGWVMLEPDVDLPSAEIKLQQERVVHGRLFDLQGRPAPGVTLSVASLRGTSPPAPTRTGRRFDGVAFSFTKINDLPGWLKPMTTDAEGRYTLRGLGKEQSAVLIVYHPRFALQRVQVEANAVSESKPLTAALAPAQIITGRVTYADTGKGVPHARLDMLASQGRIAIPADFETDADGRFRINPPPADRSYNIGAYPPEGEPYLIARKRLEWPKGALEQSLDIVLPRGILIHGNVTEEGSGKPVVGASVAFVRRADQQDPTGNARYATTAADGSFRIGAAPTPGLLLVRAAYDDYVPREFGMRMLDFGEPGGPRVYAHAFRSLDLKLGVADQRVDLMLRHGATVTGHLVGPDSQPVVDALVFCRAILDTQRSAYRGWTGRFHRKVQNGQFQISGLDPDTEATLYFMDPKRKLAVAVAVGVSTRSATSEPVSVRLEACGAAEATIVDAGGKPVVGTLPQKTVAMVVTPGPTYIARTSLGGKLAADDADVCEMDTVNYRAELVTDAHGKLKLPALIPGANYRFVDWSTAVRGEAGPKVRKEFSVKPGETLDLGDLVIEKPHAR